MNSGKIIELINKKARLVIALLLVAIFFIGAFKIDDYGIYTDQPVEKGILFMNLQAYAYAFLGEDSGYAQGLSERDLYTDVDRTYGASALYILTPFTFIPYFRNNAVAWSNVYRLAIWVIVFLSLVAFYASLKKYLRSRFIAATSTIALWISPRFFAESTYNNKDMVATALVILSVYFGMRLLHGDKNSYIWALLFGFISAVSTNMRLTGIVVWGCIGIAYIVSRTIKKKIDISFWVNGFIALLSMPVFYYLLSPAMWKGNIVNYIEYLIDSTAKFDRTSCYSLVNGTLYNTVDNPNLWTYLFIFIAVTIPLVFLIAIIAGFVSFLYRAIIVKDCNEFVLVNACILLTYFAIVIITNPIFYNGWRHMYFLSGPLFVFLAYFMHFISKEAELSGWVKAIFNIAIWGQIVVCGIFIIRYFPNEYSYYNILAGKNTTTNWDGDYWGVGAKSVIEELADKYGPCTVLTRENFVYLNLEYADEKYNDKVKIGWYTDADYVLVNNCHTQYFIRCPYTDWSPIGHDSTLFWEQLIQEEPLFTINSGNQTLWSVYENPVKEE